MLDFLDKIPGKIFPKLKPKMVDGFLVFPHKLYREFFHIFGSLILIMISFVLYLYISTNIPIIFFIVLCVWMTYQEFYLHPKKYNQKLIEGIFDWLSRIVPFGIYLFILY